MKEDSILVVDDSEDFIFLLTSLLKFHHIQVDASHDPVSGMKRCEKKNYSLIISDYMMDQMDGLEFCQKLRASPYNFQGPAILISAKDLSGEEMEKMNKLSMIYVKKPIMPNELYRKITDTLGKKL